MKKLEMKQYLHDLRLTENQRTFEYLQDIEPVRKADTISHIFYNKVGVQEQYEVLTEEEMKLRGQFARKTIDSAA